jgi:Tfp pilus assembly protein PilV
MMKLISWLKRASIKQGGLSLVETMIALGLTGIVSVSVASTMFQFRNASNSQYAQIMAVTQVENGVHYMNRDVQSAQTVTPQGTYGFPLSLSWVDWDTNITNTVIYSLQSEAAPLTTFSLMRTFNQNPSSAVAKFIVSYPSCSTTLTLDTPAKSTVLQVADTATFPPIGALQIAGEPLPVTYSGKTSNSFTGIPASGSGSLTLAHAIGEFVTAYSSYCSYDSAEHKFILQLTSIVGRQGKQQEETRQLVIIPRPGS